MKITDSSIMLNSSSSMQKKHSVSEEMELYIRDKKPDNLMKRDILFISDEARDMLQNKKTTVLQSQAQKTKEAVEIKFELSEEDKNKIRLIERFMENLIGKKVKLRVVRKMVIKDNKVTLHVNQSINHTNDNQLNYAFQYRFQEKYLETESMNFQARGNITTATGKQFDFSLEVAMDREYRYQKNVNIRGGNTRLIDPLVINLDGESLQLTDDKFKFDLNSDGQEEEISFATGNNGFLALDKNNDGIINNGSELFGPETGSGFAELADYDLDGNGWLDESDPVLTELKIWSKDSNGNDRLETIVEEGIGAIYLANVENNFSLKDTDNNLQGMIKNNGVYLRENGNPGVIHEIDLNVEA